MWQPFLPGDGVDPILTRTCSTSALPLPLCNSSRTVAPLRKLGCPRRICIKIKNGNAEFEEERGFHIPGREISVILRNLIARQPGGKMKQDYLGWMLDEKAKRSRRFDRGPVLLSGWLGKRFQEWERHKVFRGNGPTAAANAMLPGMAFAGQIYLSKKLMKWPLASAPFTCSPV